VRRAALSAALLVVALVLQLTVVNRLPLPGAGGPDLVLLLVVALGLSGRPATGAVTGFCAGLCLDIAPPGSYLIGEYALVFCLIGYLCGRLSEYVNRSALVTILAAMGVSAAGEALYATIGLAVSNPQVTWASVRHVLPPSVLYDVALSPFVLYLVLHAMRFAEGLGRVSAPAGAADGSALLARTQAAGGLPRGAMGRATVLGGAGLLGGAGWLAGPVGSRGPRGPRVPRGSRPHPPRTPNLRQAAARAGDGWLGGTPRTGLPGAPRVSPARPGRPPRLRPGSGTAGSAIARPYRTLPRTTPNLRMGTAGRRRDGNLGRTLSAGLGGVSGAAALRGRPRSGPPGSAFRNRPAGPGRPAAAGRPAASGHGPKFRPDTRLRGGSANPGVLRGGAMPRPLPARRVSLRLGNGRRHDGMLGGSALRGTALAGRRLTARPVSLRLGSGRRGDGALGGLSGAGLWSGPRRAQRKASPRFRSGGGVVGGHSVLGRKTRLRAGKQARFAGRSLLATWTGGRLGGRSTVWRIGSRRTGGLR
jgi:rod shape-determining protein MreD